MDHVSGSASSARAVAGRRHHAATLGVLLLGALAFALSQTLVAPALPEIRRELHTSTTTVSFVLTAYLLTASLATPIVGRLGDMFGKRRTLLATLALFGMGSLVSALSQSIEALVAGRAIQGVAGAVFPLSFGIIRDELPSHRVATAIGVMSATFGLGGGAGLVLSGLIVDNLAYEWIFWVVLIVVTVAILATHLFVPESPVRCPARIDWIGAALLSAGLVALLTAVSQAPSWGWGSFPVACLFGASAAVLSGWAAYERHLPEPLVDMRMMREPTVLKTNLTGGLVGFGMFGSFILVPQLLQSPPEAGFGFGASVTEAGLFLLPSAAMLLVSGPLAGWLCGRFGSKPPLLFGTFVETATFVFLVLAHSERWCIYLATSLLGVGIGFASASMATLIVEAVEQRQTGVATGMNTIMRTTGGCLGAQVVASILAGHASSRTGLPAESGFTAAFGISALGVGSAFLLAMAIPGRPRAPAAVGGLVPERT